MSSAKKHIEEDVNGVIHRLLDIEIALSEERDHETVRSTARTNIGECLLLMRHILRDVSDIKEVPIDLEREAEKGGASHAP